jgi:SM-20-related protein
MSSPSQIFDDTPLNVDFDQGLWEQGLDRLGSEGLVILDGLWKNSHLELLRQDVLRAESHFRDAQIGKGEKTQIDRRIRSDQILWLDEAQPNPVFKLTLKGLKQLQTRLSESLRCSFSESEFHLTKYPPGAGYSAHVDQSPHVRPGQTQRYLSLVMYLNPEWSADWGGHLLIYEDSQKNPQPKLTHRIKPEWNRTVLFLSQTVLHEVETSSRERLSLTGWLRK